jgi:(S)-2-hydroxyglutarate dehydrogenase
LIEKDHFDIIIIGGGILGCSIAYFLSFCVGTGTRVLLVEQEHSAALHTSSRNTGKVHAPFLYDPSNRKLFAKASSVGFEMLMDYTRSKQLPFVKDGIMEVATDEKGADHLYKYLDWGYSNGLTDRELKLLDRREVAELEPNIRCISAIYCTKDASVDYGAITNRLLVDATVLGCRVMFGTKLISVVTKQYSFSKRSNDIERGTSPNFLLKLVRAGSSSNPQYPVDTVASTPDNSDAKASGPLKRKDFTIYELSADYLINAAGGAALHIAHGMGLAEGYQALHFKGEYWEAPSIFRDLTKMSVYSVPRYPEYPFLDPHWIVRIDGRREVGPNAVLVSGPYAYNWHQNMKFALPKILESISDSGRAGLFGLFTDRRFISLAIHEARSSMSKKAMINRAKAFLPALNPSYFTKRGTSGIRSSLINKDGKFVPDILFVGDENSVHILNYNSPGATGALPVAAMLVSRIVRQGICNASDRSKEGGTEYLHCPPEPVAKWDIHHISDLLTKTT